MSKNLFFMAGFADTVSLDSEDFFMTKKSQIALQAAMKIKMSQKHRTP